jgi:hypothetical protein
MAEDPVLSAFAAGQETTPSGDGLVGWLRQWRLLWPDGGDEDAALGKLESLVEKYGIRREGDAADDWRNRLEALAVRILRRHREQPVTVFCHLLLCALELHRLRQGLLQRALFNDLVTEAAA